MTIVIQLMNSLKFVTQINGVYQSTSSSRRQLHQHTICQIHIARKVRVQGRAQGVHLPWEAGSLYALRRPAAWVAARGLFGWWRRRALASAGSAGPLRWGAQHGPGIEGPWRHGASVAAGYARLLRPPAARGSFSCWRRRATTARGLSGGRWAGLLQPAGGAPSAGGGAGQWPLASSIYGGWRVSSWGQARVRQTIISWAVGFSHGPVAWGPIHLHWQIVKTHLFSFANWCFYRLIRCPEILKYRQIVR